MSECRKYWTIVPKGYKKPIRLKNLGEDYTEEAIKRRLIENQGVRLMPFAKQTIIIRQYRLPTRENKIKKVGGMYTLTEKCNYEIIAAFKTVAYTDSSESFKYYRFVNADSMDEFNAYINKCKELALYDTGVTAEYGDKLITLSTCEYVQAFFLRSFISLCGSAPSVINIAYSVVCVIHHKFVSCRNGGFEVIFFKAIGIYYRIEQLLIIYIERQVRDNEIVIYVRILLFDFINTTTT